MGLGFGVRVGVGVRVRAAVGAVLERVVAIVLRGRLSHMVHLVRG